MGVGLLMNATGFLSLLLQSWVLVQLWGWFALPLGAPEVTVWHAAGLLVIARHLTARVTLRDIMQGRKLKLDSPELSGDRAMVLAVQVAGAAVALGWGFVASRFLPH